MNKLEKEYRQYRFPGTGTTLNYDIFQPGVDQRPHYLDQALLLISRPRLVRRILENIRIVDGFNRLLCYSVPAQPVPGFMKYLGIEFVPLVVVVVAQAQVAVQQIETAVS